MNESEKQIATLKHDQEILYQQGQKGTYSTRQYIEGNNPKEIEISKRKKTKPKKRNFIRYDRKQRKSRANIKETKKGVKEKIRKSKKIKNRLTNLKIYHQNVRGLKSKIDSLAEIIDDYEPTQICLVETHLSKEEQIQIPGYKIFRSGGTNNSRGILIAL